MHRSYFAQRPLEAIGRHVIGFVLLLQIYGCMPALPSCSDKDAVSLLKQLALGKSAPVNDAERERIDQFLAVAEFEDGGKFGARQHCAADLSLSEQTRTALGDRSFPGPIHVQYDIILPLDQSVVSVAVVELKNYSTANIQTFSELYGTLP